MKILYDHQTFVYQNFGGISRYFVELATELKKDQLGSPTISCLFSDNENLIHSSVCKPYSILEGNFPGRMTLYNTVNRIISNYRIQSGNFDIFHATYYDNYFFNSLGKKPFVITVYDMIHELYPGFWTNQEDVVKRKKELITKASAVIAISENTKSDILKLYPDVEEAKIKVVHLGNSFNESFTSERIIEDEYLLFVGRREHYKNFDSLLKALRKVFALFPNLKLICAGGGNFSKAESEVISQFGFSEKVLFVPIENDKFLAGLYQHARIFVFPSLYEGFGIPILEAFSMKCPVILSRSSCFPEVAGEAAEYFDGTNEESISEAIISLLLDNDKQLRLKEAGKKRLQLFSWKKNAEQTASLYQKIIDNA